MTTKNNIALKAYFLYFFVLVLMLVVMFRVVAIQYGDVLPSNQNNDSTSTSVLAEKLDSIPALRGRILSEDGSVLVTSIPLYDLHIDLKVIKEEVFLEGIDSLAWNLSQVFPEKTKAEWEIALRKARTQKNQYFKLKNKVKYTVYQKVKNFPILRKGKYKGGFIVERYSKQHKPHGILAERTLGYVREDIQPVGIEGAYNEYLAGESGTIIKKYVNGSWKPVSDYIKEPVNGADVITAIDINIQDVAENELMRQLKFQNARHGTVVLMEVETGYIKAIANLTRGEDGNYYEFYNHAVGLKTVPGSTFKLATLMALLEDKKASLNQIVNATGAYNFYDVTLHDSRKYGYGKITLKEAFEVSSNIIAKVTYEAYKANPQQFIDRLKSFGLAEPLGLDLKGEPTPTLNNVGEGNWSGISIPWMSIGYEVQQTPLQTLAYYNAIANNGEYLRPLFVKEIRKDGQIIEKFDKVVLKEQICSKETVKALQACLEGVVENGTGRKLKSSYFKIAGKTGTVKLSNGNKGYSENSKYQASFCGYFPADKPKYSCIVVIAGPTKQIYGAQVSGSVFKAIADKVYASSLQYHQSLNKHKKPTKTLPKVKYGSKINTTTALKTVQVPFKDNSADSEWIVALKNNDRIKLEKRKILNNKVPNVLGMPLNDAVYLLENAGLKVRVEGTGQVVSQSQKGGNTLVKGTLIKIVLK
ncbi:MAG TPA: PASTA domain-containing protein [Crocinitomix sp.]|nr:PASTA domain-containing protein [Crocinitomix sp.]